MDTQNEFRTKDIYLATYLQLNKFNVIRLEKKEGTQTEKTRFMFIFEKAGMMKTFIEAFYARRGQVEPMEYSLVMKQLKSKMYNYEQNTY